MLDQATTENKWKMLVEKMHENALLYAASQCFSQLFSSRIEKTLHRFKE
jgi:hypothetical protein